VARRGPEHAARKERRSEEDPKLPSGRPKNTECVRTPHDDPDMDAAIAGLIGVGVGAVVSGGFQATSASLDRRRVARSSARLIFLQLHDAQAAVEDLRACMSWDSMITEWQAYGLAWEQHAAQIALVLRANECLNIASAFHCLASLARSRAKDAADPVPEGQAANFDPSGEVLDNYVRQIQAAKYLSLKAAYSWREHRRGESARGLEAATKEMGA
jgi:hypothetical protein